MNRRNLASAAIVVMLAMIAVAAWVGQALPGDMPLPTHWDIHGEPDRFSDKWTALLLPVLMAGGLSLLFYALPALETRHKHFERSQGVYLWAWAALLMLSLLVQLAAVSVALRWGVHGSAFVLLGVGMTFVLIGNQLGKTRSMYLIGIRTPWTLASEEVWIKTHRLGGKLMVASGVALAVASPLPLPSGLIATIFGAVIAVSVIVPIVYSFLLYRREQGARRTSS